MPMQQPALRTRDVRLSPITLVVALPGHPSHGAKLDMPFMPTALHPHALDKACINARRDDASKQVACGYLFMDGGADVSIASNNTMQVGCVGLHEVCQLVSR